MTTLELQTVLSYAHSLWPKLNDGGEIWLQKLIDNKDKERIITILDKVYASHGFDSFPSKKIADAVSKIPYAPPNRIPVYALREDGKTVECVFECNDETHARNKMRLRLEHMRFEPDDFTLHIGEENYHNYREAKCDIENHKPKTKPVVKGLEVDVNKATGFNTYISEEQTKSAREKLDAIFDRQTRVNDEEKSRLSVLAESTRCFTEWESDFIKEIYSRQPISHILSCPEKEEIDQPEKANDTTTLDTAKQEAGSLSASNLPAQTPSQPAESIIIPAPDQTANEQETVSKRGWFTPEEIEELNEIDGVK